MAADLPMPHGAPVPGTELPIPDSYTPQTFAEAILTRLGAPVTKLNVADIMSWEAAEGGHWNNSAKYNPLNTTKAEYASKSINSANVQAYKNWGDGINATLDTLNLPAYATIVESLGAGGEQNFGQVVAATPWGTNPFTVNVYPKLPVVDVGSAGGKTTAGNFVSDIGQGAGKAASAAADVAEAPAKLADFVVKDWWIILLVIFALVIMSAIIIKSIASSKTVQQTSGLVEKIAPLAAA